jgi:hypothetical protein
MKPHMEVLFFENKAILERILGRQVEDLMFLRGEYESKKTLEELLANQGVFRDSLDLLPLRETETIRRLLHLLRSISHRVQGEALLPAAA